MDNLSDPTWTNIPSKYPSGPHKNLSNKKPLLLTHILDHHSYSTPTLLNLNQAVLLLTAKEQTGSQETHALFPDLPLNRPDHLGLNLQKRLRISGSQLEKHRAQLPQQPVTCISSSVFKKDFKMHSKPWCQRACLPAEPPASLDTRNGKPASPTPLYY